MKKRELTLKQISSVSSPTCGVAARNHLRAAFGPSSQPVTRGHRVPAATRSRNISQKKTSEEQARPIYAQRSRVAEFAHAWIKERCGLRQIRCRGRLKATLEATWACLTYNLMGGSACIARYKRSPQPLVERAEVLQWLERR